MSHKKILLQLDTDSQTSVFDSVVAVDAGVDHLFRHNNVSADGVRELVYGAMFTRGPTELKSTAIFVGGSDVASGEAVFQAVQECFFEPIRVSSMIDSNGANTTAAAAVLSAAKHIELRGATATVLAATGPVGSRVVRLLARQEATVRAASRTLAKAQAVCDELSPLVAGANVTAHQVDSTESLNEVLSGADLVICAGAAGIELLPSSSREAAPSLRVAIDLNAVPPLGIEGIQVHDRAADYEGVVCYGAIGVGGLKMKIHKAAIRQLFESNDQRLDAEEIFAIGAAMS